MTHTQVLGSHGNSDDGDGLTLQDLLDLLKRIPAKARGNYLMVVFPDGTSRDITGISFAQSDQAEKWDFNVYLDTQDVK